MDKPQQRTFPWPTLGGYDIYEVMSALQKSIRRGLEEEALFWASEMDYSSYGDHLWKRLRVIASEDVGLADSEMVAKVRALYSNWMLDPKCQLFYLQAVVLLVRSPKSRMIDNLAIKFNQEKEKGERPHPLVPDWALDKHTSRGRALGRGMEHFLQVGAQLNHEVKV